MIDHHDRSCLHLWLKAINRLSDTTCKANVNHLGEGFKQLVWLNSGLLAGECHKYCRTMANYHKGIIAGKTNCAASLQTSNQNGKHAWYPVLGWSPWGCYRPGGMEIHVICKTHSRAIESLPLVKNWILQRTSGTAWWYQTSTERGNCKHSGWDGN